MPQYLLKNLIGTFKYIIHTITCYCICKLYILCLISYNVNYCVGTLCGVNFWSTLNNHINKMRAVIHKKWGNIWFVDLKYAYQNQNLIGTYYTLVKTKTTLSRCLPVSPSTPLRAFKKTFESSPARIRNPTQYIIFY